VAAASSFSVVAEVAANAEIYSAAAAAFVTDAAVIVTALAVALWLLRLSMLRSCY
jgi:hypothetical protein